MEAKYYILIFPSFIDVKRLIGRKFQDPEVQSDMEYWPFEVINSDGTPKIQVEHKGKTKSFYAEEISSMVLTKMKETAEAYLGEVRAVKYLTFHSQNIIETVCIGSACSQCGSNLCWYVFLLISYTAG